jgi:hypothetical protein
LSDKHQVTLNSLISELTKVQEAEQLIKLTSELERLKQKAVEQIEAKQRQNAEAKKQRKHLRQQAEELGNRHFVNELNLQSVEQKKALKELKLVWQKKINDIEIIIDTFL